jgi:hypothetical protein
MPGYGTLGPDEGTGLLPWAWALRRLTASRNYWVATVWPDGRPHVMPVWGVWSDRAFWFSSAAGSRKARNISKHERCTVATENAIEPVIVEGSAAVETDPAAILRFVMLVNAKYEIELDEAFKDPTVNATVRLEPRRAFALTEEDFEGSPTRWTF